MSVSLEVSKRALRPRANRNKLRHEGQIPGIINGYQIESTPISVATSAFKRILKDEGLNAVVRVSIEGKEYNTLIHQITTETFTKEINHIELLSVNMSEETEVEAEIVLVGEAPGVKLGGALTQNLYSVIVSATPDKLPEKIEVDISKLSIGQSITVADLEITADFTIVTDGAEQICAISEARAAEETVEEAPAAE
ncbi:MAG: 50S ribosomal protein L25/general stress protein Ctc [Enterococcus sp.]|nr:50S ribosomal protein L25/general stress protein Ctc [Enterococcus sp.]MBP7952609.1 50S ribosomal protein L25/general stress protein Ctc [Enterococcus sp.]MBP8693129.1 50S ribosomal protein L25/general stress protein Ctc [Enterococcus sp.]MBP9520764.1 50S ribosomal protein L25/general stress protein Ctc [Enterococcus sp.]MBP9638584.1 50S ribosomal protein L25/general stress protein Ctc [Enterococcus sp.]